MFFLSDYYPATNIKLLSAFFKCINENEIEIIESERTVHSREGYSGTLDALVRYKGQVYVADWKTGDPERIGPPCQARFKHKLQLAAYQRCSGISAVGRMVIYIRKDKQAGKYCLWTSDDLHEAQLDYDTFLCCKKLFERSKA
jgi:ATP-dependent exoDNAse (exonuclease V) beta subunit